MTVSQISHKTISRDVAARALPLQPMPSQPVPTSRLHSQLAISYLFLLLTLCLIGLMPAGAIPNPNGSSTLVISQIYVNTGDAINSAFSANYIEIHNMSSTETINLSNTSVQYSFGGANWFPVNLSGTLGPGKYLLIQYGSGAGLQDPVEDIFASSPTLSSSSGKVAIVNCLTPLATACPASTNPGSCQVIDLVGYGSIDCSETSPATPSATGSTALTRLANGNTDTNNNLLDVVNQPASPRNRASGPSNPSPTAVTLMDFTATVYSDGVWLDWNTAYEIDNLGFNVYREQKGKKVRLNRSLIAGVALQMGNNGSGDYDYSWLDKGSATRSVKYWLEDVDLNGTSTWHGPALVRMGRGSSKARRVSHMLDQVPGVSLVRQLSYAVKPSRPNGYGIYGQLNGNPVRFNRAPIAAEVLWKDSASKLLANITTASTQVATSPKRIAVLDKAHTQ